MIFKIYYVYYKSCPRFIRLLLLTGVWASMLRKQFQNRSEFETEHGKSCTFFSKIGSSIPTFRDMRLNLFTYALPFSPTRSCTEDQRPIFSLLSYN